MSQLEEQILKQNVLEEHRQVHELQVRIKELRADVGRYVAINAQQAERAEKAEAELAKLRGQEPIKYLYRVTDCFGHDVLRDDPKGATILETIPLYANPIPAPAVPEPVRQPYDTGSIMRRNVADLELALKQQAGRAEAAESELLAVREDNHSMMLEIDGLRKELAKMINQKPALYMSFSDCGNFIRYWTRDTKNLEATMAVNDFEVLEFYARPVPAAPRKYHEFATVMLDAQPFITAETYGGRYIVAMRFERLDKMQDCHAALLALLKSAGENS